MELSTEDLEIRNLCANGDYRSAVRIAFESYGQELFSFLVARFPSQRDLAEDAFATCAEDLLRTMPQFEWRCSMRTWCYKLARSAATQVGRVASRGGRQRVPLSELGVSEALIHRSRTGTALHMRTEVKDKLAELRASLTDDDRELLTLRIDRELSWREIAFILLPAEGDDSPEDQRRREGALRQRLSEIKRRLRKLALEAGII